MAIRGDVRGIETQYLLDFLEAEGSRILEVGCGDGRLTRKYAATAAQVVGIDVKAEDMQGAREAVGQATVDFSAASAIHLPFRRDSFDHALFAWSF